MKHYLVMIAIAICLFGCIQQTNGYVAVSAISRNGFAIDGQALRAASGREVKLWGFVDHGNLYGDEGVKAILQEWWSGEGTNATIWRFNLKGEAKDAVGHSFPVYVANDPGRDALLKRLVADARAGKPTRVFVKGRLFTFDAATNAATLTGLYMEVRSSGDVLLALPGESR